jgi:predicted metal-dependent phosphoesterase TrpH
MTNRLRPLLAEFHAHTTWSDGKLTVRELVDLYGGQRFDVLCVTDHVNRTDDPWHEPSWPRGLTADRHDAYLAELRDEAERARERYGLIVLPGLELTFNDLDPLQAAHAVAVGLDRFVSVDDGIEPAMRSAAAHGAALIAAHPFNGEATPIESRRTERFSHDPELAALAHRFELFNRSQRFGWVAETRKPAVANGDAHNASHVFGWKTLLICEPHPDAIVEHLRSSRPAYPTHVGVEADALTA